MSYIKKAIKILSSNLVEHAKVEMKMVGLDKPDADYDGMLYNAVLELIEVFASQGHSGFSAELTLELFNELAKFQNLSDITANEAEWEDISEMWGSAHWQNKRNSALFSEDNGKTYYNVEDKENVVYTSKV